MAAVDRLVARLGERGYAALVADRLVELRRAGMKTFAVAWSYVMAEHPPGQTWTRCYLSGEESALDALRRVCEVEWSGGASGRRLERPAEFDG